MEIGDHLFHAGNATGHTANHVVLVAVIDAHVRVGRPDQDGVDPAVSLLEIVDITVDGVLAQDGIIKVKKS